MEYFKTFVTVTIAVIIGNIATPTVSQAIGKLVTNQGLVASTFTTPSAPSNPLAGFKPITIEQPLVVSTITLKNLSEKKLYCEILKGEDYISLANLEAGRGETFEDFTLGTNLRCNYQLTNHSTTMLTYLKASLAGKYEFSLDKVPCSSCTGQNWKWATTFTDPNGKLDYTHWK